MPVYKLVACRHTCGCVRSRSGSQALLNCPILAYDSSSSLKHCSTRHANCSERCWSVKNSGAYRNPTDEEWNDWLAVVWTSVRTKKHADKYKSSIPARFHYLLEDEPSTEDDEHSTGDERPTEDDNDHHSPSPTKDSKPTYLKPTTSESPTLTAAFVLDPTRGVSDYEDAFDNIHFMKYEGDRDFLTVLHEKCPRLVHLQPGQNPKSTQLEVIIWEFLMVYVAMTMQGWIVVPLSWTEFKSAVLSQRAGSTTASSQEFGKLCRVDVIIGAIDVTMDFQNPDSYYKFADGQFEQFYQGLKVLNQYTVIWPNPAMGLVFGQKVNLAQNLQDIALKDTLTPYPAFGYVDFSNPEELKGIAGKNAVLKRGFSECGLQVNLPPQPRPSQSQTTEKDINKRKATLISISKQEKKQYDDDTAHRPQWFLQPYIPQLRRLGELRVLFVNQTPQYVVHTETTSTTEIQMSMARTITPLSQLREALPEEHLPLRGSDKFCHSRISGGWTLREDSWRAEASLLEFATKVVRGLIVREEALTEGRIPSDLRLFCRVDVGVMRVASEGEEEPRYEYFVNEVERGHAAGFFGRIDQSEEALGLATTFVRYLPAFITLYDSTARS